jgi:hypothetical protein
MYISRDETIMVGTLPSLNIMWPGVPGRENIAPELQVARGAMFLESDGLWTPGIAWRGAEGVIRTLSKSVWPFLKF